MGVKRNKLVKKITTFYKSVFKFQPPFQVLCDGNFMACSVKYKFDLKSALEKLLEHSVKIVIPSCVATEVMAIKNDQLRELLRYYKPVDCSHETMEPDSCIKALIGKKNKSKYFVATQDNALKVSLRSRPGVPLLFHDKNMIMLDKISNKSKEAAEQVYY